MRGKLAACLLMILLCSGAVLAATGTSDREVLKGPEAFGDWQKDKPGVRRLLKPRRSAPSWPVDLKPSTDRKEV